MNNSFAALGSLEPENVEDRKPQLREREATLVRLLSALEEVHTSSGWSTLKTEVFASLVERLEKDLLTEAQKRPVDQSKLAHITGQLDWAKKYADLDKLASSYRIELQGVRLQLHGKTD